jgi:hypothetical protein
MVDNSKQAKIDECMATFKRIPLTRLQAEIESATEQGKYCLIVDQHGNCNVFFTYKTTMRDFHKEVIATQIGKQTINDALEELRKALVYSMRIGDTFVVNCEKVVPNFWMDFTDEETFPADEIFHFFNWRENEKYMKVVKPEENVDLLGNKRCFMMKPEFTLVMLQRYKSEEDVYKFCRMIPHSQDF